MKIEWKQRAVELEQRRSTCLADMDRQQEIFDRECCGIPHLSLILHAGQLFRLLDRSYGVSLEAGASDIDPAEDLQSIGVLKNDALCKAFLSITRLKDKEHRLKSDHRDLFVSSVPEGQTEIFFTLSHRLYRFQAIGGLTACRGYSSEDATDD